MSDRTYVSRRIMSERWATETDCLESAIHEVVRELFAELPLGARVKPTSLRLQVDHGFMPDTYALRVSVALVSSPEPFETLATALADAARREHDEEPNA